MRFLWLNFDNHSGLPLQQGGLGSKVTEGTQVQISRVAASDVTYIWSKRLKDFLRKKPKRNGGGCVSVSGQLTVWQTLGAERGGVPLDLTSEQKNRILVEPKKYTSKRTSSNEAMKSRAVHGSQVFE